MLGLYIHIPYCRSKCRYCDFYSAACSGGVPDAYVDAVCREIDRFYTHDLPPHRDNAPPAAKDVPSQQDSAPPAAEDPLPRPDTLYFGGGTPSLLRPDQLARMVRAAAPKPGAEITMEANPDTVSPEALAGWLCAGINRLSLGVQTARDDSLARLGRRHTAQQSRTALRMAREAGFANISGDAMLALPGYTTDELRETLTLLSDGGCTHISAYLLKIEPNTVFGKRPPDGLPDDDAAADFYLEAASQLAALGYTQYEISNFARPGYESRHNLIYWNCDDYIGIGPAAHGCLAGRRFSTPAGTAAFLSAPAVYTPQGECTAEDFIMLQLRLAHGLSLPALRSRYGAEFSRRQLQFCRQLAQHGLAEFTGDTLRLTPRGLLVQNSILCELLFD